jgi:TPR repeat protein
MYVKGTGVVQDFRAAVRWYRKAAEQGDAEAQNSLGARYDSGQGVVQDCLTSAPMEQISGIT